MKSLQDWKLRRDELDDRCIKQHINSAVGKVEYDFDNRIEKVMDHLNNLQEPLHAKFLILSKEAEGLARQNMRFVKLYRECLQDLSKEIKEKK